MQPATDSDDQQPDAHLERIVAQVKAITESWATSRELWIDSVFKDPIEHFNDEPGEESPILLLCSDGPAIQSLHWDDDNAIELRDELEKIGVYLELEDGATAAYRLIDYDSQLQQDFDRHAQWKWVCRLIEADTADVSGDLYQYFAERPNEFHRLPPRQFEELVSSIFAARGWKTVLGPGSGDEGVDLRVWQEDPLGDLLTLVQIKRYAPHRPIHLEAVAALEAHVDRERANRGLFVTSSRFLPGVQAFANRSTYRMQLAAADRLQQWCVDASQAARTARNRALALDSFGRLVEGLRHAGPDPRLVVGGRSHPSFCVVVRETRTSALLVEIPSILSSGDLQRGERIPVLDGAVLDHELVPAVFRASRSESNGRVSYWGRRTLYWVWDGRPVLAEIWD